MSNLKEGGIQVAVFDLRALSERARDRAEDWRRRLSLEEQARADCFRREDLRWNYLAAHVALRACLTRWLGIEEAALRFVRGSFEGSGGAARKPAIEWAAGMADLRFNLSHTEGVVLIAGSLGLEIGVDIEFVKPLNDLDSMAGAVMSSAEHGEWVNLQEELRLRAFYQVWSRKEAYLKAIGLGLYRDLGAVSVPVGDTAGDFRVRDVSGDGEAWVGTSLEGSMLIGERYEAALCWRGESRPGIFLEDCRLV